MFTYPSALSAGAKRSGATSHMAVPQSCYLAKGAKRSSHTTNTIKFDRIPFDPCNSIKRFDLSPFDEKNSTFLQPPLEPPGLYRTDGKRPDGVTMIPWEMGKQLVWYVTVVDALASSRLNQGSLCNPRTTATEAEARKIEKHRELKDNG